MAVGDAYVFPGFSTPVLTLLFFPEPPITFLTWFCRGERRKYAGKKSCLNRGWKLPGHESDTFTTEPFQWLPNTIPVRYKISILKMLFTTVVAFVASADKDQASQNVQPDLRFTLSALRNH